MSDEIITLKKYTLQSALTELALANERIAELEAELHKERTKANTYYDRWMDALPDDD